jgi:hypothetical protein
MRQSVPAVASLHRAAEAAGDQLARVLCLGWERMRCGQLADRAIAPEQAASVARTLALNVVETETTAGEKLERFCIP